MSRIDHSAVIATFKDEMNNDNRIVREIGVMSEFWSSDDQYKLDYLQDWANERGNDQHSTAKQEAMLTVVCWEHLVY